MLPLIICSQDCCHSVVGLVKLMRKYISCDFLKKLIWFLLILEVVVNFNFKLNFKIQ